MKHLALGTLLSVAIVFSGTAQNSLTIIDIDRNPWGSVESIIQTVGTVENTNGSGPIDVKVRRITIDTIPGTQNYFCWEQCYEPPTNESPTSLTIPVGDRVSSFYGDYKPLGNVGVSTLAYCFFDVNNEADSVCATVRYHASPVGIQDVFMGDESGVSESYPNPATRVANINYALHQGWQKAELKVYSMLGSRVKTIKLKEDQGTLKMDVTSMPSGMYFYTLVVDGNDVNTRKMLVTK